MASLDSCYPDVSDCHCWSVLALSCNTLCIEPQASCFLIIQSPQ